MKINNSLKRNQKLFLFILLFGLVGGLYVFFSSAATSAKYIEPETNTLTGNTSVVADATASNGQYVLFEACPVGQTGTPPNCVTPPVGGFQANCIVVPSVCGFPDETNTGVPAGTSLTNSGSINITQDGTVIQNLNVTGQIFIRANNVTIKNSRITSSDYYPIDYDGGYSGLLVEDTEIYGTSKDVTAGVSFAGYTARRVYIHGTVDGFKADSNVIVEDSYVTGLRYDPVADSHNDGLQTTGGNNVTVRHNTFKLGSITGISSVIQMGTEWSSNNNWLVENNLIDGGGWSINAQAISAGTNRVFNNNRFTRNYVYGIGDVPNSTWSGNYYDNNNEAIVK